MILSKPEIIDNQPSTLIVMKKLEIVNWKIRFLPWITPKDRGKISNFFLTLFLTNQKLAKAMSVPTKVIEDIHFHLYLKNSIFDRKHTKNTILPSEGVDQSQKFFLLRTQ